jgi:hypothetical protein
MSPELPSDATKKHPVQVYIESCRLRTLATWKVANLKEKTFTKCEDASENPECIKIKNDRNTINHEAKCSVCSIKSFWEENDDIKNALAKIMMTNGLSMPTPTTCKNECP